MMEQLQTMQAVKNKPPWNALLEEVTNIEVKPSRTPEQTALKRHAVLGYNALYEQHAEVLGEIDTLKRNLRLWRVLFFFALVSSFISSGAYLISSGAYLTLRLL